MDFNLTQGLSAQYLMTMRGLTLKILVNPPVFNIAHNRTNRFASDGPIYGRSLQAAGKYDRNESGQGKRKSKNAKSNICPNQG